MSLPILTYSDFTSGELKIPLTTFQQTDFADYITRYERKYLRELFSDKCYDDIKDQTSLDTKYTDLINGVEWIDVDNDNKKMINLGFKELLKYIIYYHYYADYFSQTTVGKVKNQNENATLLSSGESRQVAFAKYNEAINLYNNDIIPFILEYETLEKTITGQSYLAGVYTLASSDTKYLVSGDVAIIDGVEYTVSSVTANVSFKITASAGMTFTNKIYKYEPFKDFNLPILEFAWL